MKIIAAHLIAKVLKSTSKSYLPLGLFQRCCSFWFFEIIFDTNHFDENPPHAQNYSESNITLPLTLVYLLKSK